MRLAWSLGIAGALLSACSSQQAGDGSWTPRGDPGPVDRSRACVAAQRAEVRALAYDLQRVVTQVLKRADEPQQETATRVRWIVHRTDRQLERRCDEHTDLAPLLDVVDTRVGDARGALDEPTLRLVVDTFEAWVRDLGVAERATLYYHRNPCMPFRRGVDVSVEVERSPDEARVVLVVENRLTERIYVDHGGRIRVHGLAPDGASRILCWGGSSADTAAARAGHTSRTSLLPAQLPTVEIPLVPGATLEVFDVYASAYSRITCRMPVQMPEGG